MTADELRALLTLKISNDKRIAALLKKIAAGKGSFGDTMNYALISGELTGEQLAEVVLELTEDREELVRLLVHDRWEDINEQCAAVQTVLDERNALHLAPQKASFPTERVMQIAHSLSDPTVSDDTIRRRARSVSNVVVSMHDDFIEANAKFRSGAGLQCFVTRETDGSCCPWCTRLAGRYKYPEDIPDEIFQRHDNCGCTVTYENGRKRQDVWSKRTWEAPDKEAESQKPTVFNREQAQKLQADNAPKRLTGGGESGIILSDNNIPRLEAASPFKNPSTPLIIDDIMQSKHIKNGKRYNDYMQSHQYEPSILTINNDKIQELVNRYHGTGILKYDKNGKIINSEIIIDNDEVVGYVSNNQNGMKQPTTAFKIQYGKNGTHIVPTYESQKQYWKERRNQNGYDWLLRQKS